MTDADEYKYDCPQEGCGRETTHVEEDYFQCRCGWFGQRISSIEDLEKEVKRLRERLIRAYDWAEKAVNGNDSAMMDYTEYVCGDEEE